MKERDEKNVAVGDFIDRLREIAKDPPEMLNRTIITAQGVVFFAAGFETTSNTLSTLTYNLATHPEIQDMVGHDESGEKIPSRTPLKICFLKINVLLTFRDRFGRDIYKLCFSIHFSKNQTRII